MTLVQVHHGEWAPTDDDLVTTDQRDTIDGDRDQARFLSRVEYATRLRIRRLPWAEVARRAGYADKGAACTAVLGYMRRRADESAAELREQESAALDYAAGLLTDRLHEPRVQDTWLRNRARYAALNGLNAPVQVALSSGAQAAMLDALAELDSLVMGSVTGVSDEPLDDDTDEDDTTDDQPPGWETAEPDPQESP